MRKKLLMKRARLNLMVFLSDRKEKSKKDNHTKERQEDRFPLAFFMPIKSY